MRSTMAQLIKANGGNIQSAKRVHKRQTMEYNISRAFIKTALEFGMSIAVDNGDELTKPMNDAKSILAAMFDTDSDTLHVYNRDGKAIAWVSLVYGNDGYDVISDYTTNIEFLMSEADKLANKYEELI